MQSSLTQNIGHFESYKSDDSLYCDNHQQPIGLYFCIDCLSFNLCSACVSTKHNRHQVNKFKTTEENIEFNKQYLLQGVQDTLKQFKSRQNEMKNYVGDLTCLASNIGKLKQQLKKQLKDMFTQLQTSIDEIFAKKCQEDLYQKQVSNFYQQYNAKTDELRQVLLDIVDGNINMKTFSQQLIQKQPPLLPQFNKIKNKLEKKRNFCKSLKNQFEEFQQKVQRILGSKSSQNSSRYDKFIRKIDVKEPKQPFLRTLQLIDKENQPILNRIRN